ncbi:hypothetical protein BDN72DRAFT_845182 [Pluteus cervinus]|uniref:Uncharacterized protein n=1 Tax=Pluteus cervinus TaxID=181527 RepID=A0ACD3AJ81_9AGAR|nr:hypothetical protein BDN72DRAFT_845182 [Pluteus cervinus]
MSEVDPRLPLELEKIIFTYALQNRIKDLPSLFLVARRISQWLAREAFKVVILSESYSSGFRVTLPRFKRYGKHIQSLLIDYNLRPTTITGTTSPACLQDIYTLINECISCCPNLIRLGVWHRSSIAQMGSIMAKSLPLTHLTLSPHHLYNHFNILFPSTSNCSLLTIPLPLFQNITHLDLLGTPFTYANRETQAVALSVQFPSVTHLSLGIVDSLDTTALKLLFKSFIHLRILVLWLAGSHLSLIADRKLPPGMDDDDRIVNLVCNRRNDWEAGARGSKDTWALAEQVVAKRAQVATQST